MRGHEFTSPLYDEIIGKQKRREYEAELVEMCKAIAEWYRAMRDQELFPETIVAAPKVAQA